MLFSPLVAGCPWLGASWGMRGRRAGTPSASRSHPPPRPAGRCATARPGEAGMEDRSSRAHHSPGRTPQRRERRTIGLCVSRRWGPARIGRHLGVHPSTVHRVLARFGLARLRWLDCGRATGRRHRNQGKPGYPFLRTAVDYTLPPGPRRDPRRRAQGYRRRVLDAGCRLVHHRRGSTAAGSHGPRPRPFSGGRRCAGALGARGRGVRRPGELAPRAARTIVPVPGPEHPGDAARVAPGPRPGHRDTAAARGAPVRDHGRAPRGGQHGHGQRDRAAGPGAAELAAAR